MPRLTILDPTAQPPDVNADPGPPLKAATLATDRVGIRYDLTWRTFDWVRDEWEQLFRGEGSPVEQWCAGDRTGEAADATLGDLTNFVGHQEVLISGLGN
jgi:hypothetical protein